MDENLDLRDFSGVCRLFPLPGIVMFPHAVLPLHIFEPRYREMTRDALASDRLIAIVQLLPTVDAVADPNPPIAAVACLGRIIHCDRLPDGRFNFLLKGLKRIRIARELDVSTLYRQAEVEILEDMEAIAPDAREKAELIAVYRDVARRAAGIDPEFDKLLDSEPPSGVLTDLIAQSLGLPPALKQTFLEDRDVDQRTRGLLALLKQVQKSLGPPVPTGREFPPPFSLN